MYATHIDALQNLGPVVSRIARKHASLQVAPEHYPIVGKYLLEALQDHPGLEVDHTVLGAWGEAYGQLASIFIKTEEDIYSHNANKSGGWRGFRPFVIRDIVDEASGIKSVYLQAEDGQPIADFEAGHQGYLNPSVLSQWLGQPDADVYFCGPTPFMDAVNTTLLGMGFKDGQLHYEVFGPSTRLPTH